MIKILKYLYNRVTDKPVETGLSVSFDSSPVREKQFKKAHALPVSDYSAKYILQPQSTKYIFEFVSICKFNDKVSLYELRCVQTGEIMLIDRTAFEMLLEKIKVKK
jgi:hypothetical protein